jgi:amidase
VTQDATALAAAVRAGDVSPRELVDAAIARIEALDGDLGAVIHHRFEAARAEADAGPPDGPFRGVPILLKDLGAAMAGEPHHQGNRALRDAGATAAVDSHVTTKLQAAGFVVLGRTNTPELGLMATTEPEAYGPTRNPWSHEHSPGGSSGGSGAAVAAGMVSVAHGGDGGGSIRIPASCCGLVGLKPARGRISAGPEHGESWSGLATDGVLTTSVRDTAAILDVLAGPMPGDPYWAAPPTQPFTLHAGAPVERLRIGFVDSVPDGEVHPECVAAVRNAVELLAGLGHDVAPEHPRAFFEPGFHGRFVDVVFAHTARDLDVIGEAIGRPVERADVEGPTWAAARLGREVTAVRYLDALEWVHDVGREMAQWWASGWDVLVTPVLATPPPRIGDYTAPGGRDVMLAALRFTAQLNVSGQPGISLPLHVTADGLPVGVQLVGPPQGEDVLLRLAAQVEEAAPWAGRLPAATA